MFPRNSTEQLPIAARSPILLLPRHLRTETWGLHFRSSHPAALRSHWTQWGTRRAAEDLPSRPSPASRVPGAAVVVNEPRALFDPFALQTKGSSLPQRLQAQRRQELGARRGYVRTLRDRRRTRRQALLLHRRIRHQGTRRRSRSQHGSARRRPGSPDPHRCRCVGVRTARRR